MIRKITFILFILSYLNTNAQIKIDTLNIENYQIKTIALSPILNEISTLEFADSYFWGLNDSGGKNEIYKIDPDKGEILQTVEISNATNVDWEEMTSNDEYFFIGDFGNNLGNRRDLTIYYFKKDKITNEKKTSVEAQKIEFYFPEQKNFNPGNRKTNFDCEAFFYYNGKLHLFTKEWTNNQTTHYTLDIKPGKQAAKKVETFKTNYMVTGAYIDTNPISNTQGIYLIGYTQDGFAFISGFDFPTNKSGLFFNSNVSKFSLPLGFTAGVGQVEGITIKPDKPNVICYSNEDFKFKSFHVQQSIQCIHSLAQ